MAALFSQAFGPLLESLGAQGPHCAEEQAPIVQRKSAKTLPQIDYPVTLVVRNTFIDEDMGHPLDLKGFYRKREIQSTPVSAIEGAAVSFEPVEVTGKDRMGRSSEPDGSSSCRSTSAGSSSRGSDESPGCQTEVSPRGTLQAISPLDQSSSASSRDRSPVAGLPDFEYPAPLFVKNTFLAADLGRSLSLDGFFEERQLRSCPGSAFYSPPDAAQPLEQVLHAAAAAIEDAQESEDVARCSFFGSTPESTPMMPYCRPSSRVLPLIPLPPAEPPVLPAGFAAMPEAAPSQCAPEAPAALPATVSAPRATVLLLSNALEAAALGAPTLPSVGSAEHHTGACKPCAHAYTAKGCMNGRQCSFCHLCPPGELKRQQKLKRLAQRQGK